MYTEGCQENSVEELFEALGEAGCELDEGQDDEDLPLIVLICPELDQDEDLEALLVRAVAIGRTVIAVWPKTSENEGVPKSIEKYSSHQVACDPLVIKRVLTSEDQEPIYQNADGQTRPAPHLDRNKC